MAPPRIDVGVTHAVAVPGTRPEAIAPQTVPKKNAVTTDDEANTTPARRRSEVRTSALRNANALPRRTIPRAARPRGMNRVVVMAANAAGNALQRTTRQKMIQTWLASQTGP